MRAEHEGKRHLTSAAFESLVGTRTAREFEGRAYCFNNPKLFHSLNRCAALDGSLSFGSEWNVWNC